MLENTDEHYNSLCLESFEIGLFLLVFSPKLMNIYNILCFEMDIFCWFHWGVGGGSVGEFVAQFES